MKQKIINTYKDIDSQSQAIWVAKKKFQENSTYVRRQCK